MANRGRRGTSPLPIIRVAYVVLKRLDPNLNHAAMLTSYYTAIKDDRVPRSLCGLDQAQSIECTIPARCTKCWELLPTNAARGGRARQLARKRLERDSSRCTNQPA